MGGGKRHRWLERFLEALKPAGSRREAAVIPGTSELVGRGYLDPAISLLERSQAFREIEEEEEGASAGRDG